VIGKLRFVMQSDSNKDDLDDQVSHCGWSILNNCCESKYFSKGNSPK
jgi:hypothetical protein